MLCSWLKLPSRRCACYIIPQMWPDTHRPRRYRRRGLARVWVCAAEQRLYCAEWDGTPGAPDPDFTRVVECT